MARLSEKQIHWLLEELCVGHGFCLPVESQRRLRDDPPTDAEALTRAVFAAEGLNFDAAEESVRRSVFARAERAFARAAEA